MYSFKPQEVHCLTLVTSESCNLNCSYCEIAKSANQYYNKEQAKKVKLSLADGTFLKNIKDIFSRLEIHPKQINHIDFWGQEPTLTLNEISNLMPELLNYFFNCNHLMFSTNMVQYPERILNFIKVIENNYKGVDKFTLDIQMSFDGYENTKMFRKIDPNIILDNVEYLIRELNKENFEKIQILFHFNTVLTAVECEKLNTKEKIKNYWLELDELTKRYNMIITKPFIDFRRYNGIGLESPVHASKKQGEAFANFLKISEELFEETKNPQLLGYEQIMYKMVRSLDVVYAKDYSCYEFIKKLAHCEIDKNFIESISRSLYCGGNVGALKIRYDGTLLHCHNIIHHLTLDSIQKKQGWEYRNLEQFVKHGFFVNGLNGTEDELQNTVYQSRVAQTSSFPFNYSLTVNLMCMLREAGQIHECYNNNDELLLKHALMVTKLGSCWDANLKYMGSGVGIWAGTIRFYCNGALNFTMKYEEDVKTHWEKERENKHKERKNG